MLRTSLAVAVLTGACGQVANKPSADAGAIDGPPGQATAVTYHGTLDMTPAKPFGGTPYCNYTITLKQLDLELAIIPSSTATAQVVSGHAEALNVEATDAMCPNGVIPTGIARYDFAPTSPVTSDMALMFTGATTNDPVATLAVQLMSAGDVYQANLGFHRTDSPVAALNWSVLVTLPLSTP